jgi:cytochrome c oxidase cbb3-type subunit III
MRFTLRNGIVALAVVPALTTGARIVVAQAPAAAQATPPAASRCTPPPAGAPRVGVLGAGPADMPYVDPAAATRGRGTYAAQCINCHGTQAYGTEQAPNLVRSLTVLHDRCGTELEPFLRKGHPLQSGAAPASLTSDQITDLAHFLRQRLNDTLRGAPSFAAKNVLTGDAKAGQAFFNGPGGCTACHTATSNTLAGVGGRYDPITIQQRFLFPPGPARGRFGGRGAAPAAASPIAVRVTVTPQGGLAVSGVLVQMDDFTVALRDDAGNYRSFRRSPTLKVEKTVPLAAHIALLDTITDAQIHDVVAYLETLK